MESLAENRAMLYAILFSGGAVVTMVFGQSEELATKFELIPLPDDVSQLQMEDMILVSAYFNCSGGW